MLKMGTAGSTAAAWAAAVLFAYITNKLFVFESRSFGEEPDDTGACIFLHAGC